MQLVTEENITDLAVDRWGTARDPRLAEIMTALVRHLHDFAREVQLTEEEWLAAMLWLTKTGQISDEKRLEFILASDVLGLSMLVVQMNHRFDERATPATVLGPFHIEGSPELAFGRRHVRGRARADRCTSTESYETWTASRSPGQCWTCGRQTPTGRTRPSSTSTRRGCARSTRPARTGATACARSPRRATRSRWTDRSATSSAGRTSATSGRRTCTSS